MHDTFLRVNFRVDERAFPAVRQFYGQKVCSDYDALHDKYIYMLVYVILHTGILPQSRYLYTVQPSHVAPSVAVTAEILPFF